MPEQVHVLTITHRHGSDVRVFRTEEGANRALAGYCRDYWDADGPGRKDRDLHPDMTDQEVVVAFYEDCRSDEGAEIHPAPLED